MTLLFYITGHGFGHATRTLAVIEKVLALQPDARIVIRTSVPQWFLKRSGPPGLEVQVMEADTGVAQVDGLVIDEATTATRAAAFYQTFDARVAEEAAVIRHGVDVVVGDVPPLAFPAAHAAGVPSVALANFTWDWIYQYYPTFEVKAPGVIAKMTRAYGAATLALRMPFAGGFQAMLPVTRDIPLVARHSRFGRERARQMLGLTSDRPIVLASFGGHRTAVPYDDIARRCRITLLLTDWEARAGDRDEASNLHRYSADTLERLGLRYEDLVAAADVVVSKPGYGIVSECVANQTALLYTSRGAFAENDVIVPDMARVIRCGFIPQEQLRAGDWEGSIRALLRQPPPVESRGVDGAEVAAQAILALARST